MKRNLFAFIIVIMIMVGCVPDPSMSNLLELLEERKMFRESDFVNISSDGKWLATFEMIDDSRFLNFLSVNNPEKNYLVSDISISPPYTYTPLGWDDDGKRFLVADGIVDDPTHCIARNRLILYELVNEGFHARTIDLAPYYTCSTLRWSPTDDTFAIDIFDWESGISGVLLFSSQGDQMQNIWLDRHHRLSDFIFKNEDLIISSRVYAESGKHKTVGNIGYEIRSYNLANQLTEVLASIALQNRTDQVSTSVTFMGNTDDNLFFREFEFDNRNIRNKLFSLDITDGSITELLELCGSVRYLGGSDRSVVVGHNLFDCEGEEEYYQLLFFTTGNSGYVSYEFSSYVTIIGYFPLLDSVIYSYIVEETETSDYYHEIQHLIVSPITDP